MARIIKRNYDYDFVDMYDGPSLVSIDMEENGVIYTCNRSQCYVSKIEGGVDDVVIADEIRNGSAKYLVTRWGIPLCYKECLKNVKSIELGKNLKEFNNLTTSGLDNLEKLIIPESFDKFPPFYDCEKLKEITMPDKISFDLEEMVVRFPSLQKIVLLHEGHKREIGESEMSAKRLLHQKKLEKKELERIAEEKRLEKKERIEKYTNYYFLIACVLPYLWVLSNIVRKEVDFDLGFRAILGTILIVIVVGLVFLIPIGIAFELATYLRNHSERKILISIIAPIITVPVSWLIFNFVVGFLSLWTSCSGAFSGLIDPRFL